MGKIKKWLEQRKCMHFWLKDLPIDAQYGKGYLWKYECQRCGKTTLRWGFDRPINQSDDPLYDRKDPVFNASPPIIRIERD